MASEIKQNWVLLVVLVIFSIQFCVHGKPTIPCFFIFGDSLADSGNNNYLQTLAQVNFKPYGSNYPGGKSTGRFTNGRNQVDFIAEKLGFDHHIPSFVDIIKGKNNIMLEGVNYASGSAGIRNETGQVLGQRYYLNLQLENHKHIISQIASMLGKQEKADEHLKTCLYSVGAGSNDFLNNYFMPEHYPTSKQFSPEAYANALISEYSQQLQTLYDHGARKVALLGTGQIGCIPFTLLQNNKTTGRIGCMQNVNNAVQLFNARLKSLVDQLNTKLKDAKFIYINIYDIGNLDYAALGLKELISGCCKEFTIDGRCAPLKPTCTNPNEHAFWDLFHPTEAVNKVVADRTYKALKPSDSYPFDLSHLVQLNLNT